MCPTKSEQHQIDSRGIAIVNELVNHPQLDWVCRELGKDYGIDLEIEAVDDQKKVTGKILKVQLKSHKTVRFSKKGYVERIPQEKVLYWLNFDVPVLLFVTDVNTRKVYWRLIHDAYRETYADIRNDTVRICFRQSNEIIDLATFKKELSIIMQLYNNIKYLDQKTLYAYQAFHNYLRVFERIECADSFMIMDEYANRFIDSFNDLTACMQPDMLLRLEQKINFLSSFIANVDITFIEYYKMKPFSTILCNIYIEVLEEYLAKVSQEKLYWGNRNPSFLKEVQKLTLPKDKDVHSILSYYIDQLNE